MTQQEPILEQKEWNHFSVTQIKEFLAQPHFQMTESLLKQLAQDSRVSVQALAKKWERHSSQQKKEKERLEVLKKYEKALRQRKFQRIAGLDEAGRGPLAGPVCVAACILPEEWDLDGLDDSKKVPEVRRYELAEKIKQQAIAYCQVLTSNEEIDRLNILRATYKTAYQALKGLTPAPDFVLVDALELKELKIPYQALVKGDTLSCSIAAASILAKTYRDDFMLEVDKEFPDYGFASHKGYGSPEHLHALEQFGPSTVHRFSFEGKVKKNKPLVFSKSFQFFTQGFSQCSSIEELERLGQALSQKARYLPPQEIQRLRKQYRDVKTRWNTPENSSSSV
jgi:ribonuclease HII